MRFLAGAAVAALFLVLEWSADRIMAVVCRRQPTCDQALPTWVYITCYGIALVGIVCSLYRWYRDYVLHEIHIESGHL